MLQQHHHGTKAVSKHVSQHQKLIGSQEQMGLKTAKMIQLEVKFWENLSPNVDQQRKSKWQFRALKKKGTTKRPRLFTMWTVATSKIKDLRAIARCPSNQLKSKKHDSFETKQKLSQFQFISIWPKKTKTHQILPQKIKKRTSKACHLSHSQRCRFHSVVVFLVRKLCLFWQQLVAFEFFFCTSCQVVFVGELLFVVFERETWHQQNKKQTRKGQKNSAVLRPVSGFESKNSRRRIFFLLCNERTKYCHISPLAAKQNELHVVQKTENLNLLFGVKN